MDMGGHPGGTAAGASPMPIAAQFSTSLHDSVGKMSLHSMTNGATDDSKAVVLAATLPGSGGGTPGVAAPPPGSVDPTKKVRYRECQKNHAAAIGSHAYDGCGEFLPASDEEPLKCAVCECHRNFHRREVEGEPAPCDCRFKKRPSQLLLSSPSSSKDPATAAAEEMMLAANAGVGYSAKKRFRTKFTADQKERMHMFAEKLGWRIQKHDEGDVQSFCEEIGIKKHVLKVWMHNNKHTLGNRK